MTRRYPLQPLLELTGWSVSGDVRRIAPCGGQEYAIRLKHGVTERVADRLAVAAGLHPHLVWPDMADHAIEDASVPCEECQGLFLPTRKGHRYCSSRCRERRRMRLLYRDPEVAAAKRAARARYYAEAGDYERARERRKYHARKTAA